MLKKIGISLVEGQDPDESAALAALSALQTKAATVDTLATEVAALKANDNGGTVDPAKYVPVEVMHDLHAQIAVLSAQGNASKLDQLIETAKQEGRIIPAMESWARELGEKDIAALSAYLDKSQPIAALSAMQTKEKKSVDDADPLAALSADEKATCVAMGISEADYLATKKGDM